MNKLIYITNARIPTEKAHGYQICKMCEEFSNAGQEVELVVPKRNNSIKDDLFSYYSLKNNFKVRYISSFDFFRFEKILGKYSFYLQSLFFLINIFISKFQKGAVLYTRSPEIAWACSYKGKTIYEAHSWPKRKIGLLKFFLKKVYKIVIVNNSLKKLFIKNNFHAKNIIVAHDGVDINKFDLNISKIDARKEFNISNNIFLLGYTGSFKTMEKDKGIKLIIEALSDIVRTKKKVMFIAIGGSQQEIEFYSNIVEKNGINKYVRLMSRVTQSKLAIFQKACDVLLMPFPNIIHYRYYMSPLKMFEYMASKRPIITSNLPSIREVLDDTAAIIIEPDNKNKLIRAIEQLIDNPELQLNPSQKAYELVEQYTWGKRANRIINFIKATAKR